MLRRRLGDDGFLQMLGELCRRHRFRSISTEEFRLLAAEFLPQDSPDPELESFFDAWVYGVGIPRLTFTHSLKGEPPKIRVAGTVAQTETPADFTTLVPLEIRFAGQPSQIHWIRTSDEPSAVNLTLSRKPSEIVFNPGDSVLALRR